MRKSNIHVLFLVGILLMLLFATAANSMIVYGKNNNGNNPKVTICHIPPGEPGNAHTISIGIGLLGPHLAHGDSIGPCDGDGDDDDGNGDGDNGDGDNGDDGNGDDGNGDNGDGNGDDGNGDNGNGDDGDGDNGNGDDGNGDNGNGDGNGDDGNGDNGDGGNGNGDNGNGHNGDGDNDGNGDNGDNGGTGPLTVTTKKGISSRRGAAHTNSIAFEKEEVAPGDELYIFINFENIGNIDLKDARTTVIIPELGVRSRTVKSNNVLRGNEQSSKILRLEIPEYAVPGEYYVMIIIDIDGDRIIKYRFIYVI